ncbi:MAG: hypothetical protein Q8936_09255 [Bacillota bacterium]|nr:hypothetical protein [Bacillota bacterium]
MPDGAQLSQLNLPYLNVIAAEITTLGETILVVAAQKELQRNQIQDQNLSQQLFIEATKLNVIGNLVTLAGDTFAAILADIVLQTGGGGDGGGDSGDGGNGTEDTNKSVNNENKNQNSQGANKDNTGQDQAAYIQSIPWFCSSAKLNVTAAWLIVIGDTLASRAAVIEARKMRLPIFAAV